MENQFLQIFLVWLVTTFGTAGLILFIVIVFPGILNKTISSYWALIEKIGILYSKANKGKIKYSIQGKISDFSFELYDKLPEFQAPAIKVEWIDQNVTRKAFIENNVAVIKLCRDDPKNENLVNGTMLYVSDILLRKSGRYLSQSQKNAVELFVGYKLLGKEREDVLNSFVDSYLYPGINAKNPKISDYFDRYKNIDEFNFFIPIYLQEIIYLGEKVFGKRREDYIYKEVDDSLSFLEMYASRRIGEKVDQNCFDGNTCKFSIMIVGMKEKVIQEKHQIYIQHIRENLIPIGIETIYVLGPINNRHFIDQIAQKVQDTYKKIYSLDYESYTLRPDGTRKPVFTNLTVLRKIDRERYLAE